MTIPSEVKIGPFKWPILLDATALKTISRTDGMDKFGVTRPETLDIVVDPDRPHEGIRETLIHEVLHASVWTYGIDCGDMDKEEEIIAPLASAVLDVLRHNPVLLAYLLDESR